MPKTKFFGQIIKNAEEIHKVFRRQLPSLTDDQCTAIIAAMDPRRENGPIRTGNRVVHQPTLQEAFDAVQDPTILKLLSTISVQQASDTSLPDTALVAQTRLAHSAPELKSLHSKDGEDQESFEETLQERLKERLEQRLNGLIGARLEALDALTVATVDKRLQQWYQQPNVM
jgi:hypothetical protein